MPPRRAAVATGLRRDAGAGSRLGSRRAGTWGLRSADADADGDRGALQRAGVGAGTAMASS